jgi:flagellar L-ring protein FlgH
MKNYSSIVCLLTGVLLSLAFPAACRAGSLWVTERNNERGMFGDRTARDIGDLITIVVDESTVTTKAQEIQTASTTTNGWGAFISGLLNQFVQAGTKAGQIALTGTSGNSTSSGSTGSTGNATTSGNATVTVSPYASVVNNVSVPTFDLTAKSTYDAGGSTTDRLTANNRTTVSVVDVLPNGNLVVEGGKIIRIGKDTQYASMRGIVRPLDVQSDNTILSTQIADAQVEFVPAGDLTDAQKKGWLARFYDKVKPF